MKGCLSVNGIARYLDGVGVVIGAIVAVVKLKCRTIWVGHGIMSCWNDFTDNADIKQSSCIKVLAMSLMAVNAAQSFLSTAWHPVPQTLLITVCKLTVQTYRVSHSD